MNVEFPKALRPIATGLDAPAKRFRYYVSYGGRGSGKSWSYARALLLWGTKEPLRVLCAREVMKTIADSVHRLLSDQVAALELGEWYSITENSISGRNGSEFLFAGLRQQDANKIKSFEGVDICWVEEAQTVSKKSWDILIPTIRAEDSEIWVSFNPDLDTDDTYTRFVVHPPPGSWVNKVTYRDNPWFPAVLETERQHLKRIDPVQYENVWEGTCKTVVDGAIYANEVIAMIEEHRIRPVPYDPRLKVHTIWDMGWNDSMAIIMAQRLGGELRIIDYIEDSHRLLADYVAEIERKPYSWGRDWLPFDGNAADYKTGKSAKEIMTNLGRRVQIVPKLDPEVGIKAARMMFPRTYMDETNRELKPGQTGYRGPARLADCLKRYKRAIPTTTNEPGAPVHDEYSHGADAFRHLAVVIDKLDNEERSKMPIVPAYRPHDPGMSY